MKMKAGDVVFLHPWCIQSATQNLGSEPRVLGNGIVRIRGRIRLTEAMFNIARQAELKFAADAAAAATPGGSAVTGGHTVVTSADVASHRVLERDCPEYVERCLRRECGDPVIDSLSEMELCSLLPPPL